MRPFCHRTGVALLPALLLIALLSPQALAQTLPPGVSIEQLTPAQRAQLLQQLQQAGATAPTTDPAAPGTQLPGVLEPQAVAPDTGRAAAPPPAEDRPRPFEETPYDFGIGPLGPDDLDDLELFGRRMFQMGFEAFEPVTYGPVGPDYRLGPGDQIIITVWGDYQIVLDLTLNREGYVLVPEVGQVVLSNMTLEQAKRHLLQRMTPFYQALRFGEADATAWLDATLGKLRTIKIYVLGEVVTPGAFNLSNISTSLTALYVSGGPTNDGSLRAVRVVRENRVIAEIDLYDYLLAADTSRDVRLSDGDIVYVPDIGPKVALRGRILRPAIYEMKGTEGMAEAIRFAGRLTASAYRDRSQVVRIVPPDLRDQYPLDRVTLDVPLRPVLEEQAPYPLFDGDVVTFFSILDLRRDFVIVEGQVWRPGTYQYTPGLRLADLVEQARGLREEAYLERADIIRTRPDRTTEQLRVDLGRALEGSGENPLLQELDRVTIHSIHDILPDRYVHIEGHVRQPGRYLLHDDMRLSDLLFKAGGLNDPDWLRETYLERADLVRTAPDSITRTVEPFRPASVLAGEPGADRLLMSEDRVRIYSIYAVEIRRSAVIVGEVKEPGTYQIEENTTVNDLIVRAGGLTVDAWPVSAELSRVRPGRLDAVRRADIIQVPIDTTFAGRREGPVLENFDLVVVKRMPYWELQRRVILAGEVVFPGTYALTDPGEQLSDLIRRAGGLTPYAYPEGSRLIRTFQEAGLVGIDLETALNTPGSRHNLVMMPGDSLHVPERPNTVIVRGAVGYPTAVVYVPGKPAGYYIKRAGGYLKNAERGETRVVLANGALWQGRWLLPDPPVNAGTEIFVPFKEETDKDTWETIRDTTAVLSSLTTVLLLIWQITR